jgi:hypothetical protein
MNVDPLSGSRYRVDVDHTADVSVILSVPVFKATSITSMAITVSAGGTEYSLRLEDGDSTNIRNVGNTLYIYTVP